MVLVIAFVAAWIPLSYSHPVHPDDNFPGEDPYKLGLICVALLQTIQILGNKKKRRAHSKGKVICRTRRSVASIMYELGAYSRRYYRMRNESFWRLHEALKEKINQPVGYDHSLDQKRKRGKSPNGPISSAV